MTAWSYEEWPLRISIPYQGYVPISPTFEWLTKFVGEYRIDWDYKIDHSFEYYYFKDSDHALIFKLTWT